MVGLKIFQLTFLLECTRTSLLKRRKMTQVESQLWFFSYMFHLKVLCTQRSYHMFAFSPWHFHDITSPSLSNSGNGHLTSQSKSIFLLSRIAWTLYHCRPCEAASVSYLLSINSETRLWCCLSTFLSPIVTLRKRRVQQCCHKCSLEKICGPEYLRWFMRTKKYFRN